MSERRIREIIRQMDLPPEEEDRFVDEVDFIISTYENIRRVSPADFVESELSFGKWDNTVIVNMFRILGSSLHDEIQRESINMDGTAICSFMLLALEMGMRMERYRPVSPVLGDTPGVKDGNLVHTKNCNWPDLGQCTCGLDDAYDLGQKSIANAVEAVLVRWPITDDPRTEYRKAVTQCATAIRKVIQEEMDACQIEDQEEGSKYLTEGAGAPITEEEIAYFKEKRDE